MRHLPPSFVAAVVTVTATATLLAPVPASAAPLDGARSPAPTYAARPTTPVLVARARLAADHLEEGPPSGAAATSANGRSGPFDGQVVPGFSAMVDAGDGRFLAMPDNGFGSKANSADFLLRIYTVDPSWATASGGEGSIEVQSFISLSDPDGHAGFPIVHEDTPERLLTGADFDIESLVRQPDGTLWVGEEFGPFLLHFSADGELLTAPVPFPGGKSPSNPFLEYGEEPTVAGSRGFEAMGASRSGRYLYPVAEGQLLTDDEPRRRWIYRFDTVRDRYAGKRWAYETDQVANVIGDAFSLRAGRMLLVERDDFDGPSAVTKRVYEVDLHRTDGRGFLRKTLVLDALGIANPDRILAGTGYGTGERWSLPVQSFETVVGLTRDRLLIGNDNNYPGNSARIPGTPDDTELAVVELRRAPRTGPRGPLVIGHRGASGYRPEHTLASYEQAILQCADFIEPDLVPTRDGVLVARHENEIGGTTDVASHPEFADREATKTVDGREVTGFFTEDFTLAELRTLHARERLAAVRPQNTAFDGKYRVPTFDEVLDLARHSRTCEGRPVGVYPETKHPTYFDSLGLSPEEPLLAQLAANGFASARKRVFIQSFETANLRELDRRTDLPLVQLVDCSGAPYDLVASGDERTYADLTTRAGLRSIARYADGIGPCKDVLIPRTSTGELGHPTPVITDAHEAGLVVHPFTFRRENQFLPVDFRSSADANAPGDLVGEIRAFLRAGIDGFFTDNPDVGAEAVRRMH